MSGAPQLPQHLRMLLAEIDRTFLSKLYLPAFIVSLTIPDICLGLTFKKAETQVNRDLYTSWVDKYSPDFKLGVTGDQCYKLRCGIIHKGNPSGHAFFGADNVIITVPETGASIHGLRLKRHSHSAQVISIPALQAGSIRKPRNYPRGSGQGGGAWRCKAAADDKPPRSASRRPCSSEPSAPVPSDSR